MWAHQCTLTKTESLNCLRGTAVSLCWSVWRQTAFHQAICAKALQSKVSATANCNQSPNRKKFSVLSLGIFSSHKKVAILFLLQCEYVLFFRRSKPSQKLTLLIALAWSQLRQFSDNIVVIKVTTPLRQVKLQISAVDSTLRSSKSGIRES